MSQLKALASQTVIYGMSNILPRILHFVVFTIYLTYKFPDQIDFAIYTELYAYATIILVLLVYRMDTAFFRFGKKEVREKAFSTAMLPLFLTVIAAMILMYTMAPSIATFLDYQHKPYYIQWFALILGFDALVALPYARMRLDNKPLKFLFYRITNVLITVALVLFFLEVCPRYVGNDSWLGEFYDPTKKLDYVFLANLIASAAVLILMIPEFIKIKWDFDLPLWKKMFVYSLPLVIVGIAGNINQSFAVPIQKIFLGEDVASNMTNAGIYAAAAKMALLLNLFTVAFNYAAEPFFFNNVDKKGSKETYGKVALAFTISAMVVLLFITLFADYIALMLGPTYRDALPVVPILLFAYLFLGLYYNFSIWYKLDDKTYIGAIIAVCGALITLGISIYLLPKIGTVASAWAALVCYGFMAVAGLLTGKKYYPIPYPVQRIMSYILLGVLLVIGAHYLGKLDTNVFLLLSIKSILLIGFLGWAYYRDGRDLLRGQ